MVGKSNPFKDRIRVVADTPADTPELHCEFLARELVEICGYIEALGFVDRAFQGGARKRRRTRRPDDR